MLNSRWDFWGDHSELQEVAVGIKVDVAEQITSRICSIKHLKLSMYEDLKPLSPDSHTVLYSIQNERLDSDFTEMMITFVFLIYNRDETSTNLFLSPLFAGLF